MKIRLITGAGYVAVLAIFYLLKIFVSDLCFDALIWLFSLIGTFEMLRAFGVFDNTKLLDKSNGAAQEEKAAAERRVCVTKAQAAGAFVFAAACIPACALFQQYFSSGVQAAAAVFFLYTAYLLILLVARHRETGIENTGMSFFAAVYPTLTLVLLCLTNHLTAAAELQKFAFDSNLAILFVFVISPFSDSLAYVFGRFLKKKFPKKMAPVVSPNKTVIGGIGGLVGGLVGAAILYFAYNAAAGSFHRAELILPIYLIIGVIAAAATEFGDLAESCIKRKAGMKDMGRLLPGHGGVLDRIDGTLFATVAVYASFVLFSAVI